MKEQFSGLMLPMIKGSLPDFAPVFERYAEDLRRAAEGRTGVSARAARVTAWIVPWTWLGHTAGMTSTSKIAISLPKQVAERARQAVRRGHAPSVSAYVAAALNEKVKLDDLSSLLAEMLAESGGPLSAAERRAADLALGVTTKTPRRRRGQ